MLTEIISLPTKGNLYPKDHPLASGQIEIKHMTAKEEDILTTQSFIEKGVMLERLLDSVIVTENVDPLDLTIGDREKVLLQTRILGYGPGYKIKHKGEEHIIDLGDIGETGKPELFDNSPYIDYKLESLGKTVTVKIPNGHDIEKLKEEIEALERKGIPVGVVSIRLAHMIKAIDGDEDEEAIRTLSKELPARESMKLRLFIKQVTPDVDLTTMIGGEEVDIPMGVNFFYPSKEI